MNLIYNFQVQQIIHLSQKIVEHYYDDAKDNFIDTLTKYQRKDINPKLSSDENLVNKVNETDHIYKYVHALKQILDENN